MNIASMLNQTAVYWAVPVQGGWGDFTFAEPVEVVVRWQDKQELFRNAAGEQELSQAIVYCATPFVEGGMLYLGTLAELSSSEEGDPMSVEAAQRIRKSGASPSISGTQLLYKAWTSVRGGEQ